MNKFYFAGATKIISVPTESEKYISAGICDFYQE